MKNIIVVILIIFVIINSLQAQNTDTTEVKPWKFGTVFNASLAQTALSNWAGGGENSLSFSGLSNTTANYEKDKISWENTFEFAYGIIKQGDASVEKSDDKIQLGSKIARKLHSFWSIAALIDFISQFMF